jgi:ribosomal protein L11 methyltransferase
LEALIKIIISADRDHAESISDFLMENGALSVTFEAGSSQELFQESLNEAPLWQQTQIHGFFAADTRVDALMLALTAALGKSFDYQTSIVEDQDWVQLTQENFPAQLFADRLWITPSWQEVSPVPGVAVLNLNPGLGFGTGAHPTTSLCLTWLAQQDLRGKTVIDYGCGSGILGLSALALGAKKVYAVDHDPQALTATRNNAQLNHFADADLSILLSEQLPPLQADIILANILANPLCELAPIFIDHLASAGQLTLSGFFTTEEPKIYEVYHPQLQLLQTHHQENWSMMVYQKKSIEASNHIRGSK